jgi:uncharacterized protein
VYIIVICYNKEVHKKYEGILFMNKAKNELIDNDEEFQSIIKELITNETVQQMKNFRQHHNTTCFDHCYTAAYYCYSICKKYNLDYTSATRAAMLHDLFLYDWRKKINRSGFHAFTHGKLACENACKLFDLNEKEKDIIIKHMWPVTIKFPSSVEGFILTFVDKYCAISETLEVFKEMLLNKKVLRYAYLFLSLIIIRI